MRQPPPLLFPFGRKVFVVTIDSSGRFLSETAEKSICFHVFFSVVSEGFLKHRPRERIV